MHEMSLAVELIEQITEAARQNNIIKVDQVQLDCGKLKQVVPDIMLNAFEVVSEGTVAEGAKLDIVEVAPQARCNRCGKVYEPEIDDFVCRECEKADYELLCGDEIILKTISGEQG